MTKLDFPTKQGFVKQKEGLSRVFIKKWSSRTILQSNGKIIMEGQSSPRKQAKFSRRILR